MKTYKAPDNSLHVIDPEFAFLLPAGCVQTTAEEAEAILAAAEIVEQSHEHQLPAQETIADLRMKRLIAALEANAVISQKTASEIMSDKP